MPSESPSPAGKRRGRPPRYDRRQILLAALALVEREGASALSMRRLASEFGIEAPSLYTYVASRDDLLDGLSEVMVQQILRPELPAGWRPMVAGFANGIRRVALAYPQAFLLVGMRPLATEGALAPVEALLRALTDAGLAPDRAFAVYRLVASFARGFALAEIGGFTIGPTPDGAQPEPTGFTGIDAVLRAEPIEDFDLRFAHALETIVAGVEAQLLRSG